MVSKRYAVLGDAVPALSEMCRGMRVHDELPSTRIHTGKHPAERSPKPLQTLFQRDLPTLLVTGGMGFYNPRNTAPETGVMFVSMPGNQPARRMVETFASGYVKKHSIFSYSQEH